MRNAWFKSSFSGAAGHCVEIKFVDNNVLVKNSRTLDIPILYTREEWEAFIVGAKAGEFDFPSN